MKYFLDTNICIYFLKGKYTILHDKILSINPNTIKIPSIVKAELLFGAEKSIKKEQNIEMINQFLLPFEILSFDDDEAIEYSKIRALLEKNGNIIGPNDLIIASIVKSNNGILITNNVKEFERVEGLKIENWIR